MYRSGKSNKMADALSRQEDLLAELNTLFVIQNPIMLIVRKANEEHEEMKGCHKQYEQHQLPANFTVKEGILFFQNRIFIPELQQLKLAIF